MPAGVPLAADHEIPSSKWATDSILRQGVSHITNEEISHAMRGSSRLPCPPKVKRRYCYEGCGRKGATQEYVRLHPGADHT